ncbi:MAG: amidohydrolase [Gemmatirosa sp.]
MRLLRLAHRAAPAALLVTFAAPAARAQAPAAAGPLDAEIGRAVAAVMPKVVAWRRDIHQHPELGNRETRTAALVAEHLRKLGMEVRTTYNGQDVGVMHACGHDMHVAMLLGAAEVLAGMKAQLPGTVKFIFQPAEEGPPGDEKGGAIEMMAQGALANPKPDAIFGLHVGVTPAEAGHITYKPLGFMAAADFYTVTVKGKQVHGATPWAGVDPIVVGAQIVTGLQTVVSRQMDLTNSPVVLTVGAFQGGVRNNIIPDSIVMLGTIRTFDPAMRKDVQMRLKRTAEQIAAASGATAVVKVQERTPVTSNDPALTERMVASLQRAVGAPNVSLGRPVTGAEDFGYFAEQVPGLFVFLGVRPKGSPESAFVSNHSPRFFADEAAMPNGVKALVTLATDFLAQPRGAARTSSLR